MNYASLDLCKQLYELSGWETEYFHLTEPGEQPHQLIHYDLGFLIRKLPRLTTLVAIVPGKWSIWADYIAPNPVRADTPEDAACKLAIELFKQGVLTK